MGKATVPTGIPFWSFRSETTLLCVWRATNYALSPKRPFSPPRPLPLANDTFRNVLKPPTRLPRRKGHFTAVYFTPKPSVFLHFLHGFHTV